MSETISRPSPLLFACLGLGLADLLFLNLVVFPRVRGHEAAAPSTALAIALPSALPGTAPPPARLDDEPIPAQPAPEAAPVVPESPEPILFETGRANLDTEGRLMLDRLATRLAALPTVALVIEGHADRRGEVDFNDRLSRERAQAVVRRLVNQGIPRNRILLRAFGSRRPAVRGQEPEALRRNRRVEISVRRGTS